VSPKNEGSVKGQHVEKEGGHGGRKERTQGMRQLMLLSLGGEERSDAFRPQLGEESR